MKIFWKTILVAIIAMAGVGQASAQFRFGIKAGVNLNSLHFSNVKENLSKDNGCGFTGGIMTEFQVPIIGLCLDASLMYTHMSASSDIYTTDESGAISDKPLAQNKNFLEVPINLKYKLGLPVIHPYIFTGPSFAFKLGGDNDVFKTKTFQCAWNVGLGVELFSHLQLSGSYGFVMNNIMKTAGIVSNTSNDIKLKNNYWTITAAYLF